MANWQGAVLTNAGLALQSKVEAGLSKLNLTKLKLGDGVPAELETMTDLAHPVQEVGINSITDNEDGTVVVNGLVTNEGLTEGYYLREYGLFAKDDSGNEVLYCVSIDSNPDYLQPEGSATVISEEIGLTIAIGNAAVLNVTITPTGMATMVDLNNHNSSTKTHPHGLTAPLMIWESGYAYKVNDVRVHDKKIWMCITDNSDTVFDKGKWQNIGGGDESLLNKANVDLDNLSEAGEAKLNALEVGADYIRHTSGLQICWGGKNLGRITEGEYGPYSYSKPFTDVPIVLVSTNNFEGTYNNSMIQLIASNITATSFSIFNQIFATADTRKIGFNYVAFGTWK